jgi:hypothetical protein
MSAKFDIEKHGRIINKAIELFEEANKEHDVYVLKGGTGSEMLMT